MLRWARSVCREFVGGCRTTEARQHSIRTSISFKQPEFVRLVWTAAMGQQGYKVGLDMGDQTLDNTEPMSQNMDYRLRVTTWVALFGNKMSLLGFC